MGGGDQKSTILTRQSLWTPPYTWSNISNIYLYQTCDSPGNHWWATVNLTAANLGPLKGQSTGSLQGPDRETGWPPEAQATWATLIPGIKMIPGIHGTTTLWAKIRTRIGLEPQRIITGQTTYVHISCFHESWSSICKDRWVVLATFQVKSGSRSCNEIWILRPFSKTAEKTWSCFSLDTEQQYWTVTVQYWKK